MMTSSATLKASRVSRASIALVERVQSEFLKKNTLFKKLPLAGHAALVVDSHEFLTRDSR